MLLALATMLSSIITGHAQTACNQISAAVCPNCRCRVTTRLSVRAAVRGPVKRADGRPNSNGLREHSGRQQLPGPVRHHSAQHVWADLSRPTRRAHNRGAHHKSTSHTGSQLTSTARPRYAEPGRRGDAQTQPTPRRKRQPTQPTARDTNPQQGVHTRADDANPQDGV